MITVKCRRGIRKLTYFLSFLLIFLCLCCLCACSSLSDNPLQDLESLFPETTEEVEPASAYRIVLPSGCGGDVMDAALRLSDGLEEQTGVPSYTLFDYEKDWNEDANVREILIGRTSRELSDFYLSDLNRDDYLCLEQNRTLVLGGPCDRATVCAIDVFCERYLSRATAQALMPPYESVLHTEGYAWEEARINSYNIKEYTFVYPKENESREYEIAVSLREKIADLCGAYPPICSDGEFDGKGRAIMIGSCFGRDSEMASQTAYLSVSGNDLVLCAPDSYGLSCAAEFLLDRLFSSAEGAVASLQIADPLGVFYERPSLAMLNLLSEWINEIGLSEFEALEDRILSSDAGLITLGRMGRDVWGRISILLSSVFESKVVLLEDGYVLPVLFRTDSVLSVGEPICHERDGSLLVELALTTVGNNEPITVFYLLEEQATDDCTALLEWICRTYSSSPNATAVVLDLNAESKSLLDEVANVGLTAVGRTCLMQKSRRILAVVSVDPSMEWIKNESADFSSPSLALSYQISVLARDFVS